MAGHLISIYLEEVGHNVTAFTRSPFHYVKKNLVGDANDSSLLKEIIGDGEYDAIINCIGVLNEKAESNKHEAVYLNSYIPHFLAYLTREMKTKVIQMSTDCVFSGRTGGYNENSLRDGESFYDRSKALGELDNKKDLTFRNSIIGPDINEKGIGLFNWFMKQEDDIEGFTEAIWTGVTTLTLAKAMVKAISDDLSGIYNLVNNVPVSKYDLLSLFNKNFKNNEIVIKKNDSVKADKSLINNREDFDFKVPSYQEMIEEMREWIYNHRELYPHYFTQK